MSQLKNLSIGDRISEEEFKQYSLFAGGNSFDGTYYKLNNNSYYFLRISALSNPPKNIYEVMSTFESRIEDNETGHAKIHRKESRQFKSYYDKRKH